MPRADPPIPDPPRPTPGSLPLRLAGVVLGMALAAWARWMLDPIFGSWADAVIFGPVLSGAVWFVGLRTGLMCLVAMGAVELSLLRVTGPGARAVEPGQVLVAAFNMGAASLIVGLTDLARRMSSAARATAASVRDNEERLRLALHAAELGTWDVNLRTGEFHHSARMAAILGLPPEEGPRDANQWTERLHPADADRVRAAFEEAVAGRREYNIEHRILLPGGAVRWVASRGAIVRGPDGRPIRAVGVAADITDRHLADEALKRSEERFRLALSSGDVVVYEQDADLRYTWVFPHSHEFHQQLIGRTDTELTGDPQASLLTRLKRQVLTTGKPLREEVRVVLPKSVRYYDLMIEPRRDAKGRIVGVGGAALDLTERRRAEEARRASEARLEMAMQAGRMGAWEWDIAGGRVTWSPSLEAIHGLEPGTFGGTREESQRDIHPEDLPRVQSEIQRTLREGGPYHTSYRIIRPDGQRAWVEARGTLVRDESGAPVRMLGICADITERARAEEILARGRDELERLVARRTRELEETHEKLRLSERMASLGTLSAGLGHDMGNLLLPVRARLDAIERQGAGGGGVPECIRQDLAAIRTSADYLQKLSAGLRLLALDPQDDSASPETVRLWEWCRDTLPVLRNTLPRHVELECDVPADLPPARVPRHTLTQIVFNLVQNAGDALRDRERGRVEIAASREPGDPSRLRLRVSDNGPGMPPEVQRHCMEPFFTTKPRGISTGLGLALVHSAVERVGGAVRVQSAPGAGTAFTLVLPGLPSAPEPGAQRPAAVVSISDARMKSYISTVLRSLHMEVREPACPGQGAATLWVTDAAAEVAAAAPDGRRVILLGEPLSGAAPGIISLGERPAPSRIRQALHEAAAACSREPAGG